MTSRSDRLTIIIPVVSVPADLIVKAKTSS